MQSVQVLAWKFKTSNIMCSTTLQSHLLDSMGTSEHAPLVARKKVEGVHARWACMQGQCVSPSVALPYACMLRTGVKERIRTAYAHDRSFPCGILDPSAEIEW
eukprot:1161531-Pelagomonas_calceolata.AAC.12